MIFLLLATSVSIQAQQLTSRPERGLTGKGTQQSSGIDSINLQNGSVSFAVPLASLPPVAGGKLSYTLTAHYNSNLYNAYRSEQEGQSSPPGGCQPRYSTETVGRSTTSGGWQIGGFYDVFFRDAHDDYDYLSPVSRACDGADYDYMRGLFFKPMLRTPDGSEHELRMEGSYETYSALGRRDHLRNYYRYTGGGDLGFASPTRFYTTDGSYLAVVVNPPSSAVKWTIYMTDGTRIEQNADGGQRTIDTNGNSILYGANVAGGYAFVKDEQSGREIKWSAATYNGQSAYQVEYQTVGGVWQSVWVVLGTTTMRGKIYSKTSSYTQGTQPPDEPGPCYIYQDLAEETFSVVRQIVMPATEPNAPPQKYTFAYNSDTTVQTTDYNVKWSCVQTTSENYTRTASVGLGELSEVLTPTGATISYKYRHDGVHKFGGLALSQPSSADELLRDSMTEKKITHDGATDIWNYNISASPTAEAGAVTNPDGSTYSETFYPVGFTGAGLQGRGGLQVRATQSGKVMTEKQWTLLGGLLDAFGSQSGRQRVTYNPVVDTEYTTLLADDGATRLKMTAKKFLYDYNGQLLQTIEYDWFEPSAVTFTSNNYPTYGIPAGVPTSATILRTVNHSYYNQAADGNSTNAYQKRPLGAGATVILGALQETTVGGSAAQTRFSYDGQSYGTAPTKGNPTQVSAWNDTNNQWLNSSSTYDSYGNVITTTDPKGYTTQIFYEDATHALPTKTIVDPQNGSGQQIATTVYDFSTGLPTSSTDINGNTSTVDYTNLLLGAVDPFGRAGTVSSPSVNVEGTNKRQTVKTYYEDNARKTRTEADLFNEGDALVKTRESRDQLGRTILAEKNENGATAFTISAQTIYSTSQGVVMTSNPRRGTASSTDGWTRLTSDVLGRATEAATFSGAAQPPITGINANWTGSVTTSYTANMTTVADQAGRQRRSVVNALGQLTRVDEPNEAGQLDVGGVAAQPTNYVYDVLGNLTSVSQGVQTRNFVYDSLSRLKQTSNPESGTINYTYDSNGNLQTKIDARNITTTYGYDALNRVLTRSYSDGTTLMVNYTYENALISFSKGRLTKVSSAVSQTEYTAFDNLGRVLAHKQTTDGNAYTTSYSYNLSGALIEQTYPSGRVVKNVFENDGDLSIVQSKKNASSGFFNYAKNFIYTAAGAVSSMQLGNGKWESTSFNSRLQPTQIALGTVQNGTDKLKLNFDYGTTNNNGNVLSGQITVPTVGANQGFTAIQTYPYDSLNRLKSAVENVGATQTWKQTFTFDRYGNRNFDTANTTTLGSCPTNQCNPQIDTANNRFTTGQGYSFDLAGNLITDAQGRSFVYDAENKQKSVSNTSGTIGTYLYDGDGKRVKKVSATEETIFVYDALGKLVAEYSNQISQTPQVSYLTSDHLGSPRINTDANGNVIARHDYLPFGEEVFTAQRTQGLGYTADNIRRKFATYQRDAETDLDFAQARYYAKNLGRFYSVDPENAGAREDDPQSWNGYFYAGNNPLLYVDPNGEDYEICDTSGKCYGRNTDPEFEKARKAGGFKFENGKISSLDGTPLGTYRYINPTEPIGEGPGVLERIAGGTLLGGIIGGGGVVGGTTGGIIGGIAGGIAGGAAGGSGGATSGIVLPPNASIDIKAIKHIVEDHAWNTTKSNKGRFAPSTTIPQLKTYIKTATLQATPQRGKFGGRIVFEYRFPTSIGVNGKGNLSNTIRVIMEPNGRIVTAFPI